VFDKEDSIEFSLDSIHYLYIKSNPNPFFYPALSYESLSSRVERVQKGIAHWDKQNNDMPAPNCMLKVREKIIKDEGL